MMQRMHAEEMFMHFLDVHHSPFNKFTLHETFAPTEVTELVLHEMIIHLVALSLACRIVPVPQKWVGSSVALGFDCARVFSRHEERECRRNVCVNIFDWGRSELNTAERHSTLQVKEQSDRTEFWRYYMGGIDRLSWEAARSYLHRFSNDREWQDVTIAIYDFDALSKSDFIGKITVPLADTKGPVEVRLVAPRTSMLGGEGIVSTVSQRFLRPGKSKSRGSSAKKTPTLTYSIEFQPLPKGARLAGLWRLQVIRAANLTACDSWGTSDPFALLTAVSPDGRLFQQQTTVIVRDLCPEWNETFDLPVAHLNSEELRCGLDGVAPFLGDVLTSQAFTYNSEDVGYSETIVSVATSKQFKKNSLVKSSLEAWVSYLDTAAKNITHFSPPEAISRKLYTDRQKINGFPEDASSPCFTRDRQASFDSSDITAVSPATEQYRSEVEEEDFEKLNFEVSPDRSERSVSEMARLEALLPEDQNCNVNDPVQRTLDNIKYHIQTAIPVELAVKSRGSQSDSRQPAYEDSSAGRDCSNESFWRCCSQSCTSKR